MLSVCALSSRWCALHQAHVAFPTDGLLFPPRLNRCLTSTSSDIGMSFQGSQAKCRHKFCPFDVVPVQVELDAD